MLNQIDELNYLFELKFDGFPEKERTKLFSVIAVVGLLNYGVERLIKYFKYGAMLDYI